ncbi:MarR family winged helix-turn-helix transcriptional regulator [Nocardioides sp.]|uniref:MarR family winged helix-turn-helix transcriptional regulator n=1 Tax=Nocardioides sp. TaxID=35761 RepID=UPI0027343F79|nr:MarR family transcriptional regulator [Nocardioides sp.]MDP3893643.1 MarR family transcriptional regulator [Nocardioides sp.]
MSNPNNEIEQQLFTLLRRTFAIHVSTASGEYELERSAYGILCLIDDNGPQRLGQIAQAFNLDPSTITRQVQAVVKLGLADKVGDPSDRRATLLSLTAEGRDAVVRARAHRRKMLDLIMSDWSLEERETFARALRRFNNTVSEWIENDEIPPPD